MLAPVPRRGAGAAGQEWLGFGVDTCLGEAARGHVGDAELAAARSAGLDDGDVGEIVAHVALSVFTNYFDSVAETAVDFPAVRPPRGAVAV